MEEQPTDVAALSEHELVQLCLMRPVHQEAWYEFYQRFYETVRRQARRILQGFPAEIEDVVQDAFIRIFRVLPSYDPSKAQLRTYLTRIVTNLAIDHIRHGSRFRTQTLSLDADLASFKIYAEEDPEILRRAAEKIIDGLADKSKTPVIRDLLRGRKVKEICAEYGVTEYQVYATRTWLRDLIRDIRAR